MRRIISIQHCAGRLCVGIVPVSQAGTHQHPQLQHEDESARGDERREKPQLVRGERGTVEYLRRYHLQDSNGEEGQCGPNFCDCRGRRCEEARHKVGDAEARTTSHETEHQSDPKHSQKEASCRGDVPGDEVHGQKGLHRLLMKVQTGGRRTYCWGYTRFAPSENQLVREERSSPPR